jgi:hypothetical protein
MAKKKMYVTPECVAYMLPSGSLCQMNVTSKVITNGDDIGFSKGFSGGVEDDDESSTSTSSISLWGEE